MGIAGHSGSGSRHEPCFCVPWIFPQREVLLAVQTADGETRLARFIRAAALSSYGERIVLFGVAGALEEGAEGLEVREVYFFPKGPARVMDVEGACAGEKEDSVLEAGWVRGNVYL